MTGTLVDANIILDLLTDDPVWGDWSEARLETLSQTGPLLINAVIYAEISIGFHRIEELEAALDRGGFKQIPFPKEALFLAGKAFLDYRRRSGAKRSPLPDFFIGAQAAVLELPLITRDAARYRTYFPTVRLICP